MKDKAFTLIELLVVVLIIGILAAIAVPKYQVAVVKSEYSTLKAKTRAIAESVNRYILAKGEYPKQFSELDISLPDTNWCSKASQGDDSFYCSFNKGGNCMVWVNGQYKVACSLKGKRMYFHFNSNTLKPMHCETNITDEAATKVCLQETGKKKEQTAWCSGNVCLYNY